MPKFRTGTDDFKELIDDGGYFVDKSMLIQSVIEGSKVTLLPRPRRFGKTLNMTMLRYFFENCTEDRSRLFRGLEVTGHPEVMAHQGQHPVIYLSLKDIKGQNWDEALRRLTVKISHQLTSVNYLQGSLSPLDGQRFADLLAGEARPTDLGDSLKDLISWLFAYHQQPVVVLIDEYDSPIIEAWKRGYYPQMIDFMRAWLGGGLKHENGAALYRAVVTGILRVARESIFSGLNNMKVHSILSSGAFADKFGFTQFDVDAILTDFQLPQLAQPVREWYNGYNFGGHTIYNPWSVICCIDSYPDPVGPQWLNTASNDLIHESLDAGGLQLKRDLEILLASGELRYAITEHTTFSDLQRTPGLIWSFLLFAGYLRADDPVRSFDGMSLEYRLAIPNREVAVAYQEFVGYWHRSVNFVTTEALLLALLRGDIADFASRLSDLVVGLFSHHDVARFPEVAYHAFVLGLLANLRETYFIRSNPESGYGRADIIMQPKTTAYPLAFIIEFKVSSKARRRTATAALQQIQSKNYAAQLIEAGVPPENIRPLAIVIVGKQVKVTAG